MQSHNGAHDPLSVVCLCGLFCSVSWNFETVPLRRVYTVLRPGPVEEQSKISAAPPWSSCSFTCFYWIVRPHPHWCTLTYTYYSAAKRSLAITADSDKRMTRKLSQVVTGAHMKCATSPGDICSGNSVWGMQLNTVQIFWRSGGPGLRGSSGKAKEPPLSLFSLLFGSVIENTCAMIQSFASFHPYRQPKCVFMQKRVK